jgi:[ribosomal protein S18]-alanine N-acetyltransferase
MILQAMAVHHLDEVVRLEQHAYPYPWTRGNFADSIRDGHWAQVMHDEQQQLIGYIVAMQGVQEMHLLNITVHPARRRQGWASHLLNALLQVCRQSRASMLWLEVRRSNSEALELYAARGFAVRGERRAYYPAAAGAREDALVMALAVAAVAPHSLATSLGSRHAP